MKNAIYHNPRCSKSRETLKLLQDRSAMFEVVEYLVQPPGKSELRELCRLLGIKPLQIVRTQEDLFAQLGLSADNGYSDEQWLEVLTLHPKLIERPIVVIDGRAVIGRPPQNVLKLL